MALEDTDLIARVLARDDRPAFAELVRRHQSMTRGFLRRLCGGDESRADDLAQETFLKAYRNLAGFRQAAKFSTWLCRIAYHCYLGDLRTLRAERDPVEEDPVEAETVPQSALLRHDLDRALLQLRQEERAAVTLCAIHGMSHTEAAEVLGWPVGTVKTHVSRGKEKLRDRLRAWEQEGAR